LPSPLAVARSFLSLARNGELLRNTSSSLLRIIKGFVISASFALLLAFMAGMKKRLLAVISPTLGFLRHVPPMAAVPMLILWFGIGEASKLAVIILATFFPIFLNALLGISQCDEKLLEVARVFGYSRAQELRRVVFPFALPYILTGMRLGLGYSWRSLIGAELLAASSGLGYMILNAQQTARPDILIVSIIMIGVLGALMDTAFCILANRLAHARMGLRQAG
jgi:sulfonate transport system permease protein